jgi:hypothetical protein
MDHRQQAYGIASIPLRFRLNLNKVDPIFWQKLDCLAVIQVLLEIKARNQVCVIFGWF